MGNNVTVYLPGLACFSRFLTGNWEQKIWKKLARRISIVGLLHFVRTFDTCESEHHTRRRVWNHLSNFEYGTAPIYAYIGRIISYACIGGYAWAGCTVFIEKGRIFCSVSTASSLCQTRYAVVHEAAFAIFQGITQNCSWLVFLSERQKFDNQYRISLPELTIFIVVLAKYNTWVGVLEIELCSKSGNAWKCNEK